MSTFTSSGCAALRGLALAASLAGLMAGCQALGGGGGVMPATEVGLPPSLRGALPGREARNVSVDADGQPIQTAPTKPIVLPKTAAGAGSRSAEAGERRIRREDLEGGGDARNGGGSMGPMLSPGGGVGMGGKF